MPLAHHQHAIGQQEQFGHFRADHDDAKPLLGELKDQPIDFLLGADVDAAGRLVQEQDAWFGSKPFADHDFLLIAARQCRDPLVDARAAHRKTPDHTVGQCAFARESAQAKPRHGADGGQGDVVADRLAQVQAALLAVFGHQRDAQPIGVS